MACTPKRCWILGELSTLTFTSFTRPASSAATCTSAGLTMRHGPHHGAHRSTMTGTDAGLGYLGERVVAGVGGPGQRLMAVAAARDACRGRRDPVLAPAFGHLISSADIAGAVMVMSDPRS
jgi:hypothetical protein